MFHTLFKSPNGNAFPKSSISGIRIRICAAYANAHLASSSPLAVDQKWTGSVKRRRCNEAESDVINNGDIGHQGHGPGFDVPAEAMCFITARSDLK